jgi:hypothetical protein
MKLWNSVCKTDPAHTKHVAQRGGFTAIDAMYQVQNATEQFGPAGVGWGWDVTLHWPQNDTVIAEVQLWHGKKDQYVVQFGQKKLDKGNGPDEDAVKKAVTDGLTKCLSYLGFNADVFLGKFDDNKYVEAQAAAHDEGTKAYNEWAKQALVDLGNITDESGLAKWYEDHKGAVNVGLKDPKTKALAMSVKAQYATVKAEQEVSSEPQSDEGAK